ncbi:hypothetical protein BU16DRAFT_117216 [Lophium mytilinum]|uniref:F-box domain-containing protein n=1 Tax=Lophium mytilinum TaxID=390894 RepID=A0A6A6QGK0_9PEZI|nr:hypothetical protein BU16DRAFT_117216 [Lophium mytilinum]
MDVQTQSGLMSLPSELMSSIASFLSDSDLTNLCHVSKCWNDIATRDLWQEMGIVVTGNSIEMIRNARKLTLDIGQMTAHPGPAQIRKLHLFPETEAPRNNQAQVTTAVLSALTPNKLIQFSLLAADADCLGLLARKQKRLEHLSMRYCCQFWPSSFVETLSFPSLKKLCLYKTHAPTHELSEGRNNVGVIIQNASNLTCLQYTCLPDQRERSGLENALRHRYEGSTHSPLRLQSLMLSGQDLSIDTLLETITSNVELCWIRTLYLRCCPYAHKFLAILSRENKLLLKTFVFAQHNANTLPTSTLTTFLQSFSGLEHLCIDLNGDQPLPAIEDFGNHAATLVTLIVNRRYRRYDRPAYSLSEIAHLCALLSQLQRLAIQIPALKCPTKPGDDFISQAGMTEFLKAVTTLPSLNTLRITNMPCLYRGVRSSVDVAGFPQCADQYLETLESLATQCFKYLLQTQKNSKVDQLFFSPLTCISVWCSPRDCIHPAGCNCTSRKIYPQGYRRRVLPGGIDCAVVFAEPFRLPRHDDAPGEPEPDPHFLPISDDEGFSRYYHEWVDGESSSL